jgi:hypothetical protein
MTRHDFQPGDLVEDSRGRRWVISPYLCWSGTYLHGAPATKSGKRDRRYDGQYIDPAEAKLIKREEEKKA